MAEQNKPKPAMLGTGMLRGAANALRGRNAQIDLQIEEAESGQKRKKRSEQLGVRVD